MDKITFTSFIRRALLMIPAVIVQCFGVTLCLIAGLGADPFTGLQQGISIQTGISVGTASLMCVVIIIAMFLILDRKLIGLGSLMSFLIGPFIDMWSSVLFPLFPTEISIWLRVVLMIAGTLAIVLALTWYIPLHMGLQALDMLSLFIGKLVHSTIGTGMMIFYAIAFICSYFMGADWGVGTLVNVFLTGKLIDWFLPYVGRVSCFCAGIPFTNVNDKEKHDE